MQRICRKFCFSGNRWLRFDVGERRAFSRRIADETRSSFETGWSGQSNEDRSATEHEL